MTGSDNNVVIQCAGCLRRFRVSPARAALGVCSECERDGFIHLPEPPVEEPDEHAYSLHEETDKPLFRSEQRMATFISVGSSILIFLALLSVLVGVAQMLIGDSPATLFGVGGAALLGTGISGWIMSTLVRIGIAIINRMSEPR